MKWLLLLLSVAFVLVAVPAMAAEPSKADILISASDTMMGQVTPTTDMWFYQERLRQYMDPKMSLRRISEEKARQRRARLAAQRWYGYSNIRPTVGTDPLHGNWGVRRVSGVRYYPYGWSSFGPATTVVQPSTRK